MKDEEKNVFNIYKRFLKDNGVFYRAMQIHKQKMDKFGVERFMNYFIEDPKTIMSTSTLFTIWANTKEKKIFWWNISNKWKVKCLKEKIGDYKYTKYDYKRAISMLIKFETEHNSDLSDEDRKFVALSVKELDDIKNKLI